MWAAVKLPTFFYARISGLRLYGNRYFIIHYELLRQIYIIAKTKRTTF